MTSNGLDSPPGVSLFRSDNVLKSPKRDHKILLSYESNDGDLRLPIDWSYKRFLSQIQVLFPTLGKDFTLIDADFLELNEDSFSKLKLSKSPETWLFIRKNDEKPDGAEENSIIVGKPRLELLKYDVHPNALTQSGNYHFSSCYQAFCEFIDNAIQATNMLRGRRTINLHIFLKQKIACIFDNGEGMTSEGMKAFASYFLSRKDRGLEKDSLSTYGFLDGNISKFGVGATQAGFYLGGTIKVITKKADSPFVTEIAISKEKLHERAENNEPVFEDYKYIRNPGDTATLGDDEFKCLTELIKKEPQYKHFTMIVIKDLQEKHIRYMHEDSCNDLAINIAHVYHYYLHGIHGRLNKLEFERIGLSGFHESTKTKVAITVFTDKGDAVSKEIPLAEVKNDLQSRYQTKAKSVFSFCLELKLHEISAPQVVQGCLMYFPNESGEETLPKLKSDQYGSNTPEPAMFECFWQGRLAPLSYVNRLDFCSKPEQRSRKQKDLLPDVCFKRVRGLLFFNRLTPVSNNKLKILLDTRMDLSDALSDASSSRRLPQDFRQWLERCHREYDREIIFSHELPNTQQPKNGDIFYAQLKMVSCAGEEVYTSGDIVKIDTRPHAYGKTMYFIKKGKSTEVGSIIFQKLPEEVYGDSTEDRPVMRIIGKPDETALNKVLVTERLLLPYSIKVFEGDDRNTEVPKVLEFPAGEKMKQATNFWVAVYNGERTPKNITEVHQKKIGVKVEVTGRNSLVNQNPIEKRFGFKSFYLDRVGKYDMKFSVLLANSPCNVEKKLEINITPNIAEIVNLIENSPDNVPLGSKVISFILSFHDVFENNTCLFKSDINYVKLTCQCDTLTIKGVKESYKPNKNGQLVVKGISVEPTDQQISLTKDYEFWIVAEGIGDVMFPFKLVTGPPEKVQTSQLESYTFENYDSFPEFDVNVLDNWNQPSIVSGKNIKLALMCNAFNRSTLLSTISNGKAKFPTTSIKVLKLVKAIKETVKICLVIPESGKKKHTIKEVIKELYTFQIEILPSNICQKINIIQVGNETINLEDGLDAIAGSVVKNLKVIGFGENGKQLSDEEFLAQGPYVTTTWAEVNLKKLPFLPECPVTNIIHVNVQTVQCFYKYNDFEIRNEARLRISVQSGSALKWSFQPLSNLCVHCDKNKDLAGTVKIVALDQHHNITSPKDDVFPVVTVEHSSSDKTVEHTGILVLKNSEFFFTPASILSGMSGKVTLYVKDKDNQLTQDSISLQLDSGAPSKLSLNCSSLMDDDKGYKLQLFSNSSIQSHLICSITDRYGNATSTKTTLSIEWSPTKSGSSISKKTNGKGEAMFPANSIKCFAHTENVKFKIFTPDLIKTLKPVWVRVQLLQCNRVTKVIAFTEDYDLIVSSNYPAIKISHETEDKVQAPDLKSNISITLHKPSGTAVKMDEVYPAHLRLFKDKLLILKPKQDCILQEHGIWFLQCQYKETRVEIRNMANSNSIIKSDVCKLPVLPGPACRFIVSIPENTTLFASSGCDVQSRTLLPISHHGTRRVADIVQLCTVDTFGNRTESDTDVHLSIRPIAEEYKSRSIPPQLEKGCSVLKMKGGVLRLPRIALAEKTGNKHGHFYLVFSAINLEEHKIKFAFSSTEELEKVTQQVTPLRNKLAHCQKLFQDKQDQYGKQKNTVRTSVQSLKRYFDNHQPSIKDIDIQIAKIRNQNYDFERREHHLRKCRKEQNYPSDNVRQYIKGLVCELAYVTDGNISRILSWYAQSKMKVALCETREQQRKVYDLGCAAYSENLIVGFRKNGFNPHITDMLPIDLPRPPQGFRSQIDFAVNLLEFKEGFHFLRSTLFWSIFNRTIFVRDLEHAQKYREHVVQQKQSCPAILTLQGDLIASDGLMDPSRRCPAKIEHLKYSFGELPPTERKEYQDLRGELLRLEELRRVTFDTNIVEQEMNQVQLNLQNTESLLLPQINELDKTLDRLRKAPMHLCSPPKRKKR